MREMLKAAVLSSPYFLRRLAYQWSENIDRYFASPVSDQERVFFIVGSQRSGTTLLGLILDSHPDIVVVDEPESYDRLLSGCLTEPQGSYIGFKVPTWTHKHGYLNRRYPNAQFLFVQRDVRAIAYSMITLMRNGRNWVELYGAEDLERTLSVLKDKQYAQCAESIYRASLKKMDWLSIATVCAHVKNGLVREYLAFGRPHLTVVYEDMVQSPKKLVGNILEFLQIEWCDSVLKHHDAHSGLAIGDTDSSRRIDLDSLEKWRSNLSDLQIEKMDAIAATLDEHV